MNLKTREERAKLLKSGFFGNEIEKMYNTYNNNRIIKENILKCPQI